MKTFIVLFVGITMYVFGQQNDSVAQQLSEYKKAYQSLLIANQQKQTGDIIGTVIDAVALTPIEKSVVEIIGMDKSIVIGKDGQYKMSDIPKGFYQIRASAKGYVSETKSNIDIGYRPEQMIFFKLKMNPTDPPDFVPVDVQPQPILFPAPKYPESAKKEKVEATIWAKMLINEKGFTEKFEILKTILVFQNKEISIREEEDSKNLSKEIYNAMKDLQQAAKEVAVQWKFTPAMISGEPLRIWVSIPFRFKLDPPHKGEKKSKK